MKLTKQQLIKVIKEELDTMLAENGAPSWEEAREAGVDPWPGYEAQLADLGASIDTMSNIYDIFPPTVWSPLRWRHPSPSWEEAIRRDRGQTDLQRRKREYLENPPPWIHTAPSQHKYALRKAREAGDTGWGPDSLEESIKENLASILKELDTAAVSVRVKKLPPPGDPPSPRYLTPAQANLLGPGLKPGTPGEVPEEEWKKGGRVKFAWPRGVKGAGRRKTRYIQKDYLQTDPWG
tara:strand:+ start:303 stop:1010 length:708 start_codon:yes stop_codon:yes gene_type:complete